jgi:hypothetical protein
VSGAALASDPALCIAWEHPDISAQQAARAASAYHFRTISRW